MCFPSQQATPSLSKPSVVSAHLKLYPVPHYAVEPSFSLPPSFLPPSSLLPDCVWPRSKASSPPVRTWWSRAEPPNFPARPRLSASLRANRYTTVLLRLRARFMLHDDADDEGRRRIWASGNATVTWTRHFAVASRHWQLQGRIKARYLSASFPAVLFLHFPAVLFLPFRSSVASDLCLCSIILSFLRPVNPQSAFDRRCDRGRIFNLSVIGSISGRGTRSVDVPSCSSRSSCPSWPPVWRWLKASPRRRRANTPGGDDRPLLRSSKANDSCLRSPLASRPSSAPMAWTLPTKCPAKKASVRPPPGSTRMPASSIWRLMSTSSSTSSSQDVILLTIPLPCGSMVAQEVTRWSVSSKVRSLHPPNRQQAKQLLRARPLQHIRAAGDDN